MDWSRLSTNELADFFLLNGYSTIPKNYKIVADQLIFNPPVKYTDPVYDLYIATKFSHQLFTLQQINNFTANDILNYAKLFGLNDNNRYLQERIIRIFRFANLIVNIGFLDMMSEDHIYLMAYNLNYRELNFLCSSSTYLKNICTNRGFWYNKIKKDFIDYSASLINNILNITDKYNFAYAIMLFIDNKYRGEYIPFRDILIKAGRLGYLEIINYFIGEDMRFFYLKKYWKAENLNNTLYALRGAAEVNNQDLIKLIIEKYKNSPNIGIDEYLYYSCESENVVSKIFNVLLSGAAKGGHINLLEEVHKLYKYEYDAPHLKIAAHIATTHNKAHILEYLLALIKNPQIYNTVIEELLIIAQKNNYTNITEMLIAHRKL